MEAKEQQILACSMAQPQAVQHHKAASETVYQMCKV